MDKNMVDQETLANKVKQKAEGLADRIGGALEKAGHKISEAGAPSIGQKVHDLGDSLETEHKNPDHPHTV